MRLSLLAFATLIVSSFAARADTFSYTFVIDPGYQFAGESFTYLSDSLITTDTNFAPNTCTFTGVSLALTCTRIDLDPPDGTITILDGAALIVEYYARTPAFFTLGTHDEYSANLTIKQATAVGATPEPSSFALLGTGLLGVAGIVRRRFA